MPTVRTPRFAALAILLWAVIGCAGYSPAPPLSFDPPVGHAVCYGPYRDGQAPGGDSPSREEIREDLHLMVKHWNMLRLYGSGENAESVLSIIREDELDMAVMLGVWIAVEERRDDSGEVVEHFPEAVEGNRREVDAAIRLAADFPDVVVAVSVGNETQVFWSGHRSPVDILIDHVRRVRSAVEVPVTVADDFNFWNKPESRAVAAEIDFITMHAHPMWNGIQLEEAVTWLAVQKTEVDAMHPDRLVVIGETGWATSVHDEGEQAKLIKGRPGEPEQSIFYDEVRDWSRANDFTLFYFEAFDEKWKGGPHPAEVEKHWGVFRSDRSPKAAVGTGVR